MAVYKIFPTKDATLYSSTPNKNTGLDSILEASLEVNEFGTPSPQSSRFLMQFSTEEISDVVDNKISGSLFQVYLRCFAAEVNSLTQDTVIDIFPVSQSWNLGTGREIYSPEITNGVSWIWKDYENGEIWTNGTFNPNTTGSYTSSVSVGGGTWYVDPALSGSQTFDYYSSKDINVDLTTIVDVWYSGFIPNNGIIVKQRDEFVDNISIQPKLKYFSIDTHTIYPPCLEFRWDDSIINTGSSSFTNLTTQPFVVTIGENPGTFYPGSINKFRVYSRPEYPARVFQTSSYYTQNYYLPDESYYAIQDMYTNEYVIDFDTTYTKLSKDATSSHFTIYMDGLEPERYYKILIKTIINGSTIILDDNYYFKVING
jgi:hypothetical protein